MNARFFRHRKNGLFSYVICDIFWRRRLSMDSNKEEGKFVQALWKYSNDAWAHKVYRWWRGFGTSTSGGSDSWSIPWHLPESRLGNFCLDCKYRFCWSSSDRSLLGKLPFMHGSRIFSAGLQVRTGTLFNTYLQLLKTVAYCKSLVVLWNSLFFFLLVRTRYVILGASSSSCVPGFFWIKFPCNIFLCFTLQPANGSPCDILGGY